MSTSAVAQEEAQCFDRDEFVERLEKKYGELKVAQGLTDEGTILEIFASRESGSWTATFTDPNGQTCPALIGGYWVHIPKEEPSL